MALNDIIFQKQNGGMGRVSASEDPVSGLIVSVAGKLGAAALAEFDSVTVETQTLYVQKISYYEQLKNACGISSVETPATDADRALNFIDYHVKEFFRMSAAGTLYLAIKLSGEVSGAEIAALQRYTEGKIRQVGVLTPAGTGYAGYQAAAATLEAEHAPLSIVYSVDGTEAELADFTAANTKIAAGHCNISELAGCDLNPDLLALLGMFGYYGCIGTLLGAISKAAVNESIAWVGKFPLGLLMPGFIFGDLVKEVAAGDLSLINDNRYIFVITHTGRGDNYFNDSHTCDLITSDYAYIENVRTMDKATRGIRANLLPYLNAPMPVDSSTGKLRADRVSVLETVAGKALEDMEKAGELSGYAVEIDPEQNILATSQIEIQIKNVAVGVMRKILVKIGFTTKLN
jgi:hypothetical protein